MLCFLFEEIIFTFNWLDCFTVLVWFVVYQHELATGVCRSPPSWTSFPHFMFSYSIWASLVAQRERVCLLMQETTGLTSGSGRSLVKEKATHPSTPAWEIPWTEEPGRLQSTGLQRAGRDLACTHLWLSSLFLASHICFFTVIDSTALRNQGACAYVFRGSRYDTKVWVWGREPNREKEACGEPAGGKGGPPWGVRCSAFQHTWILIPGPVSHCSSGKHFLCLQGQDTFASFSSFYHSCEQL